MTTRTSSRTIVFTRPFSLAALDALQPAGSYVVETEEELIQSLSFPAYRRISVWLRLPPASGSGALDRVVNVDPAELDAALANDSRNAFVASDPAPSTRLGGDPAARRRDITDGESRG